MTTTIEDAVGVAFGYGAMWVVDQKALRQVDPASGKTSSRVKAPGAFYVATGAGAVWVSFEGGLGRFDVQKRSWDVAPLGGLYPSDIAATDDSVWVADKDGGRVLNVDAATLEIQGELAVGGTPHGIAVDEHAVWVADIDTNAVLKIDPVTTKVTATVQGAGSGRGIASCDGAVWASTADEGVRRIDPITHESHLAIPVPDEFIYGVACGENDLWLSSWGAKRAYRYSLR